MNYHRVVILGIVLVVLGMVLIVGGKIDAEKENPDRQATPFRDQWPMSMLYGKDRNLRSVSALACIVIGFSLQLFALVSNS